LECLRKADRTIWSMSAERFGANDPLAGGWVATQAKLSIKFHPEGDAERGRTLPLTITMAPGCNLKDQAEEEQLIRAKYLGCWGILSGDGGGVVEWWAGGWSARVARVGHGGRSRRRRGPRRSRQRRGRMAGGGCAARRWP